MKTFLKIKFVLDNNLSMSFQIGNQVKITGKPCYGSHFPTQIGKIWKIRERYKGTPNYYCQYKVYPLNTHPTDSMLNDVDDLYEGDVLTKA